MPLQQIWQLIESRYGSFSPQLQRAAQFVRENPQEVALQSMRHIAGRIGVSPATMTRLIQALEVGSWDAFQNLHKDWLTKGQPGVFSGPADRVIADARRPGAEDQLLNSMIRAEQHNLDTALCPQSRMALRDAATLMAAASTIAVAGLRSSFPVAYGLHYALSLFLPATRLMPSLGGALSDDLHRLQPGDALVAISIAPYSRETVELARLAHEAGVNVIGITDAPLSPIARLADVALTASTESPSHLASPIGLMAVTQALAMLVLVRTGDHAPRALRHREALFETTSAYLPAQD